MNLPVRQKTVKNTLVSFAVLGVLSFGAILTFHHDQVIGSPFEGDNYKASYIVQLFPSGAKTKNYLVKADIQRIEGYYHIVKAYMPHHQTIDFPTHPFIYLDDKITAVGSDGNEWDILLTKEIAK